MATTDIVSPDGLDLSPKPPGTVRVSKRAGMLFLAVGAIVAAMIGYGIITRGDRQLKLGFQVDELKGVTAATDTGKVIAAQVPVRPTAQGRDLVEPELKPVEDAPKPVSSGASAPVARVYAPTNSGAYAPPAPQYRELTPEEKRRELAFQREQEAINAPTHPREGFSGSAGISGGVPTAQGDVGQLTRLIDTLQGPGQRAGVADGAIGTPRIVVGSTGVSQAEEYKQQNAQDEKEDFLAKARGRAAENYLGATRVRPLSKYEIKAGWDIPAILEQALNSDLPGEIKALVREHVYDTATGKHLLIPQGSRLVGAYDSRVGFGQDGVQVAWNRIIFPDGSSVNLEGMSGQDAAGNAGLRHDVDNHYRRLIGFAALTSMFSAAFQLSQQRRGTVFTYPGAGEIAGSAAAGNMSQIGAEITRRNLNVQPTIKVPIGYRFNVRVNRDLLFEGPYKPVAM